MNFQCCKGSLPCKVQGQEVHSEGIGRDRNLGKTRGMPGRFGCQAVEPDQPAGEGNSYFHLEQHLVRQHHRAERQAATSTGSGQALRDPQGFDPPIVVQRVLDGIHLQGRRRCQTGEMSNDEF